MKITIYELLGLIKDDVNVPKKIKYQNYCWEWTGDDYRTYKEGVECFLITGEEYVWLTEFLNDEIEIIEEVEDKEYEDIEELDLKDLCNVWNLKDQAFQNKINTLIRNQKYILEQLNKESK